MAIASLTEDQEVIPASIQQPASEYLFSSYIFIIYYDYIISL